MNSAEKDVLLRGWEQMDSAAIVKDVATKGTYINMSVAFLAKRMGTSVDQAQTYFRTEIDEYVRRLLGNGQVFRAEHVLKNLNRNAKYVFYEYLAEIESDATGEYGQKEGAASGSSSSAIVLKYLTKIDDQFEAQRAEYDLALKMLKAIAIDRTLREKYAGSMDKFSLEEVFKKDELFRHGIAADIFFITQNTFVEPALQKDLVWSYLLERGLFGLVIKWINTLGADEDEDVVSRTNNQFDIDLCVMFRHWSISQEMLDELSRFKVSEAVRDSLARHGMFLKDERDQVHCKLERIFTTESLKRNRHFLQEEAVRKYIVEQTLEHGFRLMMIQNVCSPNQLIEVRDKYPEQEEDVSLCLALRLTDSTHSYEASKAVSNYILKHDADFYTQNPLVYLTELILKNFENHQPLSAYKDDPILATIPFVKTLLDKTGATTISDHKTTVCDMVKRFLKIDLKQIQQEAGDEPLSFSNTALIAKYGSPEKLEFLYYIKQYRSSFAVFVFVIEQLRTFSQVSKGQIMYACSQVTHLALSQLDNMELVAHCMAFVEMLGIDSAGIRAHIKCVRLVRTAKPQLRLGELSDPEFRQEVLEVVAQNPATSNIDALRLVSEASGCKLPNLLLKNAFESTDWFRALAFASYFDYSPESVVAVLTDSELKAVPANVAANLVTALRYESVADRPKRSGNLSHRRRGAKADSNMVSNFLSTNLIITNKTRIGCRALVSRQLIHQEIYILCFVCKLV